MDISKLFIILIGSILIYLSFLFLGFNLRNKNIKAQGLSKKDKWLFYIKNFSLFFFDHILWNYKRLLIILNWRIFNKNYSVLDKNNEKDL